HVIGALAGGLRARAGRVRPRSGDRGRLRSGRWDAGLRGAGADDRVLRKRRLLSRRGRDFAREPARCAGRARARRAARGQRRRGRPGGDRSAPARALPGRAACPRHPPHDRSRHDAARGRRQGPGARGGPRLRPLPRRRRALPAAAGGLARGPRDPPHWLACGAPVVERPLPRSDGVPAVVVPALHVPPVEPTWSSIYTNVLAARCASTLCHGGTDTDAIGFRVTSAQETLRALVDAPARGEHCRGNGTPLVAPGDPDGSLLVAKLTPPSASTPAVCGDVMPSAGT